MIKNDAKLSPDGSGLFTKLMCFATTFIFHGLFHLPDKKAAGTAIYDSIQLCMTTYFQSRSKTAVQKGDIWAHVYNISVHKHTRPESVYSETSSALMSPLASHGDPKFKYYTQVRNLFRLFGLSSHFEASVQMCRAGVTTPHPKRRTNH